MSRYIKLEDAIDALYSGFVTKTYIENKLKELPTIDIVHCKDCIHCADDWNGNQPQFTCELGLCTESVYPNDFCSVGERIEE